ncbi:hypothetical protein N7540_002674 [Penicillium herquei]|nr:hypothetical protein N7540_002674 [Penicillium herquei]
MPTVNFSKKNSKPAWKQLVAQKLEEQYATIPNEWRMQQPVPNPKNTDLYLRSSGCLTEEEVEITELDVSTLLRRIALRQISAVQVVTAYCKRAAFAQQLIKCCTELMFEKALSRAKTSDEHLERTNKVLGPLHGLPVSLKDIFDVKGYDSTIGWVGLIGKPAQGNSGITECFLSQGAIPIVKTNVAQALMLSDSYNHVFKQSLNSLNRGLISGGSSGGEAALIACHGSPMGVGTDTGGSVRIPAELQGLYGLKPSIGRIPFDESRKWHITAPPVAGPLTLDLSGLEFFMNSTLYAEPWRFDASLVPISWRKDIAAKPTRSLKIGYYINDPMVRVQPPIEVAVKRVVDGLKAAGHSVVEWDSSTHAAAYKKWVTATFADGGADCRKLCQLSGEPLIEGVLIGTEEDALTIAELKELATEKFEYEQYYLKLWQGSQLDAIICPVKPYVGMRPKMWAKSKPYLGYTSIWNWLDYAALTIPVMGAEENDEVNQTWSKHVPCNESDRINYEQYDYDLIRDMPVGVQIIGGKFGEETCVAVAKVVRDALAKRVNA